MTASLRSAAAITGAAFTVWGETRQRGSGVVLSGQAEVREVGPGPERLGAGVGRAESELRRYAVGGQPVLVLRQKGRLAGIDRERDVYERLSAMLYPCLSERVFRKCSRDFRDAVDALAEGYLAAAPPRT